MPGHCRRWNTSRKSWRPIQPPAPKRGQISIIQPCEMPINLACFSGPVWEVLGEREADWRLLPVEHDAPGQANQGDIVVDAVELGMHFNT